MGRCIIVLDGKFMQWSSVTDAPESPLLTEDLFAKYWKDEYGRDGVMDYANLMHDAKERGCSARGCTVDDILCDNRAGDNDKKLTKKQIIIEYACDAEGFIEWSKNRDKYFADMAIKFGPERKTPQAKPSA